MSNPFKMNTHFLYYCYNSLIVFVNDEYPLKIKLNFSCAGFNGKMVLTVNISCPCINNSFYGANGK